jgi:hypothetical protein
MNHMSMPSRLSMSGALALALLAGTSMTASAQTATTTPSSGGVLTTATPTAATSSTTVKRKPTSATPEMVNEAIQRSEARAAKEQASGVPQKWGSEEPFAFNPAVKRFDKSMQ